jgi:adenine-specific DNA-methyltransferase
LFPEVLTESIDEEGNAIPAIDADKLSQLLASCVVEGKDERYQFTWPDKRKAIRSANVPTTSCLRPCRKESVNFDTTQNLYLEGDNLEVLKVLRESYLGKVKMIYIDPPYNTGNDFVYNDDFAQEEDEYKGNSGQQDEQGNRLVLNTETNGRYHTDWLNMMYPRLKVARDFLRDDGVIFISIDENELANLRKICDEIYGETNFIAELVWAAGRKNDSKYVSISHEYIICYFKNSEFIRENKIIWRERKQGLDDIYAKYDALKRQYQDDCLQIERELKAWYKALPDGHPAKDHKHYNHVDRKGIFFSSDISWPGGGGPKYEILHPVTHKPVKIPSSGWRISKDNIHQWLAEDRIFFGPDESKIPTIKSYLKEKEDAVPYSVFYKDGRAASKRLALLMDGKIFENPKDEEIIQRLITFCGVKGNDIVMDFFSGSATTAHSVMQLNAEDGGNRHFIMVQLQEDCEEKSEAFKAGYKNICEIGKERIRRVGRKIQEETGKDLDIGFRVLKCDSSNMADVFYSPDDIALNPELLQADNIKPDRTADDLLFQIMPELNIPLSASVETIELGGRLVYRVQDGYLLAVLEEGAMSDEFMRLLAEQHAPIIATRNSCLGTDADAINLEQYMRSISPETQIHIL